MNILATTAALYPDDSHIEQLKTSAEKYEIPFEAYGFGEAFYCWRQCKLEMLLDFVKTRTEDVILYTDAGDSFFVSYLEEIKRKFEYLDSPIVVSAEISAYPPGFNSDGFSDEFYFRYICAGGIMGYRDELEKTLEFLKEYDDNPNDQFSWNLAYGDGKLPNVKIDSDCQIFQTMSSFSEFDIEDGNLYNRITRTYPCILHFNGGKNSEYLGMTHNLYKELV